MQTISKEVALKQQQERICDSIERALSGKGSDLMEFAISDGLSFEEKGVVSQLINNYCEKVADAADITSGDFGPYVMEVFPIITAWYPDFPLKDLICVESLDKPFGYLFYSEMKANKGKAGQVVGDKIETPLGMRTLKGQFPTGEVFGEVIPSSQFSGNKSVTAYAPLAVKNQQKNWFNKFKASVTASGTATTYSYSGFGAGNTIELKNAAGSETISINIQTGMIDLTAASTAQGKDVTLNYVWDLDFATTYNLPSVKEEISKDIIEAQPRVLGIEWTVFSEYLKKSQFNQDVRNDNTKRILNLIYQYQVRYILTDLTSGAAGVFTPTEISAGLNAVEIPSSTAINLDVKANKVLEQLKGIANKIEYASGRIEGNRIICGKNFKVFLESLNNTWVTLTPNANTGKYGFSGPREIATFSTFKVYYDPDLAADETYMTYRGTEWYDGVYYLAEFMPITPSEAVNMGVTVKQSFCSMEAYYYQKPECVFKFTTTFEA